MYINMYMHTHKETHTHTYTYIHIHICICTLPHIIPSHCKRSASCWRELASVRRNTLVCWYLCHKKYVCVCVCACVRERQRASIRERNRHTNTYGCPMALQCLALSCHVALRPLWETRLHSRECVSVYAVRDTIYTYVPPHDNVLSRHRDAVIWGGYDG